MKKVYESPLCNSVKSKRLYNPNTFNAVDATLTYFLAIIIMEVISVAMSVVLITLRANTNTFEVLFLGLITAQLTIMGIALSVGKIKKVSLANGGGLKCVWKPIHFAMGCMLIAGLMFTYLFVADKFVGNWESVWSKDIFGANASSFVGLRLLSGASGAESFGYDGNLAFGVLAVLCTPILPAIFEEWLYRGVIMKGLRELGDITALIISSLMFALMHGSMQQFIYQFLIGFAIGGVVMVTGNYIAGCLMHWFNNALAQLIVLFEMLVPSDTYQVVEIFMIIIGTFCLLLALCYFVKMVIHNTKTNCKERNIPFAKQYIITDELSYEYKYESKSWNIAVPLNDKKQPKKLFVYKNKGLRIINFKSNKVVAYLLMALGLAVALAVVILSDFGILAKLLRSILI